MLISLAHLYWEGGCANKNNLSSSMFWILFSSWRSEHAQVLKQGAGRSVFHSLKMTQSKLIKFYKFLGLCSHHKSKMLLLYKQDNGEYKTLKQL